METDASKQLYRKYYGLTNRKIKITLKDGKCIEGVIAGFFRGYAESNETFITQWHIVDGTQVIEITDNSPGIFVKQNEIAEVYFEEDHSTMTFK